MINQQTQDWAKAQLRQGISKGDIRQMLKNTGWQDNDIDQVFLTIENPSASQVPPPAPTNTSFIGPWELFKKSLSVYKQRFWTILGIYFVGYGPFAVGGVILKLSNYTLAGITGAIIAIFLLIVFIIVTLWIQGAILCVIRDRGEHIGIKESYVRGVHIAGSILWVGFITSFIVLGGFLLLIIPGTIFLVWFSLSQYVVAAENIRGMSALMKSKEYVRGRWWGVFGRFIFLELIVFLFILPISFIASIFSSQIATIIGYILQFLIIPLNLIYMFLIYENLREIKGANLVVTSKKSWFIFFGWFGGLMIPLGIIATVILLSLSSARGIGRDAKRTVDLNILRTEAELYYNDYNRYPLSLGELTPYSNSPIPTDPTTLAPYKYTVNPDGSDYILCATTEAKVEKCIDKN